MNERIKELAEQARLWAEVSYEKQNDQFTSHWDTPIGYTVSQFFEQKFAELIVRECASICELNGQSYTHSFTPAKARLAESTSNHCGLMIKKHFGVQE